MTAAEVNARVLLAMGVVIVAARIVGWGASRLRQPRVLGEILAGILLGPSLFGLVAPGVHEYVFPPAVVDGVKPVAQLGLVLFMFLIGLELDGTALRGHGHRAVVISHASIIDPISLGIALGVWLHPRFGNGNDRLGFVLFLGASMSVTAFPVLARILQETGLSRSRLGVLALACAAIDDVTAWCVLAAVVAVANSAGFGAAAAVVGWSCLFVAMMFLLVRPLLRSLRSIPLWGAVSTALSCAWLTEIIGIHAIFGAFLAGVVMPRPEVVRRQLVERLEPATLTVLLLMFFVVVGLSTRFDLLDSWYSWGVTAAITATAIAGKWGGSMIAARWVGETWRDAAVLGVLMNTRGLTELVILGVGLELGVIGEELFTSLVVMALVTTYMAAPLLAVLAPRARNAVGARPADAQR